MTKNNFFLKSFNYVQKKVHMYIYLHFKSCKYKTVIKIVLKTTAA